ncbi:hypothetical protein [Luteimonas lutimaris]|uniref:hypothetical protein n=1 Tax=Luteimonas lutimaris TaxID=698645 RepID=UPI0031DAD9FB
MKQKLFFNIESRPDAANPEARIEVTAGTSQRIGDRQQGTGDILMYFPTNDHDRSPIHGYLSYPERAEFIFSGTLQEMRSLWLATGTKRAFLSDPRFELA